MPTGAGASALPSFVPPVLGPVELPALPLADHESLITGERPVMARRLARQARTYQADSHPFPHYVQVVVSDGYAQDPAAEQELASFLGALTHRHELERLIAYVATPPEMPGLCGPENVACYYPRHNVMVVAGHGTVSGWPTPYVIAHEYGHHIQNHRRNGPWPALGWGTKRWSTWHRICERYEDGEIYPGNKYKEYPGSDDDFYYQNPGEAFAEAYAQSHPQFRDQPWDWDWALAPGEGSFRAIRADVTNPWRKNEKQRYSYRVREGKSVGETFDVPRDGRLVIKLRGPKRSDFDLYLTNADGRRLERSTGRGRREKVKSQVCGQSELGFEVRSFFGTGPARVTVSRP